MARQATWKRPGLATACCSLQQPSWLRLGAAMQPLLPLYSLLVRGLTRPAVSPGCRSMLPGVADRVAWTCRASQAAVWVSFLFAVVQRYASRQQLGAQSTGHGPRPGVDTREVQTRSQQEQRLRACLLCAWRFRQSFVARPIGVLRQL